MLSYLRFLSFCYWISLDIYTIKRLFGNIFGFNHVTCTLNKTENIKRSNICLHEVSVKISHIFFSKFSWPTNQWINSLNPKTILNLSRLSRHILLPKWRSDILFLSCSWFLPTLSALSQPNLLFVFFHTHLVCTRILIKLLRVYIGL